MEDYYFPEQKHSRQAILEQQKKFREIIGNGSIFGWSFNETLLKGAYTPVTIFVLAPGAFFVLAMLCAVQNKLKLPSASNKKDESGCEGDCMTCGMKSACVTTNKNEEE